MLPFLLLPKTSQISQVLKMYNNRMKSMKKSIIISPASTRKLNFSNTTKLYYRLFFFDSFGHFFYFNLIADGAAGSDSIQSLFEICCITDSWRQTWASIWIKMRNPPQAKACCGFGLFLITWFFDDSCEIQ
mmetsp:Transcript_11397/g.16245  ORF Transcript_11397/g.16245 Transcript_11397/m.16245 type:complete len:131 (-) Transcript_11397:28-420(-)